MLSPLCLCSLSCSECGVEGEEEQGQRDFGLAGSRETQRGDSGVRGHLLREGETVTSNRKTEDVKHYYNLDDGNFLIQQELRISFCPFKCKVCSILFILSYFLSNYI